MNTLVFFDIETGGFNWWPHKIGDRLVPMNPIIQIAATAYDRDERKAIENFEVMIHFDLDHATGEALKRNCYDEQVWADRAVPADQARAEFLAFLRRHAAHKRISQKGNTYRVAEMSGHCAAQFDMPFIKAWYDGTFIPADLRPLDTLQMALALKEIGGREFPNLKLETLAQELGVEVEGEAHDATVDVKTTVGVYEALCRELKATS